mmetsp:Transcript_30692/g.74786  ORF Transcript_30692/g.74786 Transcript_30692/m.74786 type:complete len:400 (+) Transcript_30692:1656-2855(+)
MSLPSDGDELVNMVESSPYQAAEAANQDETRYLPRGVFPRIAAVLPAERQQSGPREHSPRVALPFYSREEDVGDKAGRHCAKEGPPCEVWMPPGRPLFEAEHDPGQGRSERRGDSRRCPARDKVPLLLVVPKFHKFRPAGIKPKRRGLPLGEPSAHDSPGVDHRPFLAHRQTRTDRHHDAAGLGKERLYPHAALDHDAVQEALDFRDPRACSDGLDEDKEASECQHPRAQARGYHEGGPGNDVASFLLVDPMLCEAELVVQDLLRAPCEQHSSESSEYSDHERQAPAQPVDSCGLAFQLIPAPVEQLCALDVGLHQGVIQRLVFLQLLLEIRRKRPFLVEHFLVLSEALPARVRRPEAEAERHRTPHRVLELGGGRNNVCADGPCLVLILVGRKSFGFA